METQKPSVFGDLLRRHRVAAAVTQEELAARAGLSVRAVSDLERGVKSRPHLHTVRLLAAALGLDGPARAAFEAARGRSSDLRETGGASSGDGHSTRRHGPSPAPIVGRAREVALLERHLCGPQDAGPSPAVLLLAGEPGIGKTRLLRETAQRASSRGWRVVAGGCQRRSGHAPFTPLLEALDAYITQQTPSALRTDLRGCAWLVRLLPELAAGPIEPLPPGPCHPSRSGG